MAEVTVSGVRFHVERLPAHRMAGSTDRPTNPPIVVFVHGLLIDNMSSYYYTVANPAARAGADVILYDLRGHGGTERPRTGYSLETSVADLVALLDAMGVTEPVHLVGNSFGGTIALALAMTHPDRVANLLLIEAAVMTEGWVAQMIRTFTEIGSRSEYGRKADRFYAAIDALTKDTTFAADLAAVQPFPTAGLRSIACPVVAVYGENSDIIDHAYTLKQLLPKCDLTVVPNCSHFLITEASGIVRDLLLRWLNSDAVTKRMAVEKAPTR